jgi:PAS domain S-box-containing protein
VFLERYDQIRKVLFLCATKDSVMTFFDAFKKNVDIRERTSDMEVYPNCFIASNAVTWILQTYKMTKRRYVVILCDIFLQLGFFTPVKANRLFEDDFNMFHLNYEEDSMQFYSPELSDLVQVSLKRRTKHAIAEPTLLLKGMDIKKFPSVDRFDDEFTISPLPVTSPRVISDDPPVSAARRLSLELPSIKTTYSMYNKRSSLHFDSFKLSRKGTSTRTIDRMRSPLNSPKSPHGSPFSAPMKSLSQTKLVQQSSGDLKKKKRNLTPLTESDLVGTEDVILEGKLNQSVNAKWQPFHFILKLGGIVKKKSKDSTTPLQMIPLTDKTTCQEVHVNGKKWCFSVFTGSNTFYFEAANEDLVQSWVTMITQTAERTVMKSKNSMHFVVEAGISIGRKGEIYDLNEKAEDLFGYAPNECIGKSYIDIFPEKLQPSYKHYIESCEHDAWSVLIKTKNGEQIPVEMIVRKLPSSLFENENILLEFVRLVGSYQPVMKVPENCSLEMKEFFTQVYSAINSEYLKLMKNCFDYKSLDPS